MRMKVPLQITFKNLNRSDAVLLRIQERVAKLERFYAGIISCRVVVTAPHRRHRMGNLYQVIVDIRVPGEELVVQRNPSLARQHKDIFVAIRDSFVGAQRELEDYVRRRRGEVKHAETPPHGQVVRLVYEDGEYGFIRTSDGRELYFNSRSVLDNHFDQLTVGTEVRFSEEMGEEGPQASTVEMIRQRRNQEVA